MRKFILSISVSIVMISLGSFACSDATASNETVERAFEGANQAYRGGDYQEAVEGYEGALNYAKENADVYFNLGNAYYRLGKKGQAILNYEKALFFSPRHRDVRENLVHVNSLLEYRVEDKRNWYLRKSEEVLGYFREEEVWFVAALFYFLFIVGWCYNIWFRRGVPWAWKRKALFILLIVALGFGVGKQFETRIFKTAILLENQVDVRYGPSMADQVAFRLGEGVKVYVLDRRQDWSRIVLVDGKGGWVKDARLGHVMESEENGK